jgi:hypothetical protein
MSSIPIRGFRDGDRALTTNKQCQVPVEVTGFKIPSYIQLWEHGHGTRQAPDDTGRSWRPSTLVEPSKPMGACWHWSQSTLIAVAARVLVMAEWRDSQLPRGRDFSSRALTLGSARASVIFKMEEDMVLAMSAYAGHQLAGCGRLWALRLYGQELMAFDPRSCPFDGVPEVLLIVG